MEVSIRGKQVLLTTHKTYKDVGKGDGLRSVAEYPPFLAYVAQCEATGPTPRAITIRNIFRMAHRVVGVLADVEYVDESGSVHVVQSITLTDQRPAALLPILEVEGERSALLMLQREMGVGMAPVREAVSGIEGPDGQFIANDAHMEWMTSMGISAADATLIADRTFTIGNEGTPGQRLYSSTTSLTAEKMAQLRGTSGVAVVPLQEAVSLMDARAALAASLILVK